MNLDFIIVLIFNFKMHVSFIIRSGILRTKRTLGEFIVKNKNVFKLILFIILGIANSFLAFVYFFIQLVLVYFKFIRAKIPIEVKEHFRMKTLTYKKTTNKELKMDIYFPNKKRNLYPIILYSHGGGWISGFRNQPNNVSWCKFLASKGYVVASIDYSFGFSNTMEDILKDYEDSLAFLKNHAKDFHLDLNNIFLMGLSAGGHLALLYSSYYTKIENYAKVKGIKGVICYYTPSDLTTIGDKTHKSIFAKYAIWTTLKGSLEDQIDEYIRFSPIHYISENMIPLLIVHGRKDKTVPFENSLILSKALTKFKVNYKFLVHKKADHCFDFQLKDPRTIYIVEETARFIERSVQNDYQL